MSELVDFYLKQAHAQPGFSPWLAALKDQACHDFKQLQFPNRHEENWKYTPLRGFFEQPFTNKLIQSSNEELSFLSVPFADPWILYNDSILPPAPQPSFS